MAETKQPGLLYWSLVEPVWLPLNEAWDQNKVAFVNKFREVPERIGHLYAGHWCWSEVCNGGFGQFFYNTTGILAPEALQCFQAMGLADWSNVLAEAMGKFGTPYPRERAIRLKLLLLQKNDELKNAFDALNHQFYEWMDSEPDRWEREADAYAAGNYR